MNGLLQQFMSAASAQASATVFPKKKLTVNGVSCDVIAGPMQMSKALRDSGLWSKVSVTAKLDWDDFNRLRITDRSLGLLTSGTLVQNVKVMLIEADPDAPKATLHLQLSHVGP